MSDIIKHNNINRDNINTIQYNEFNKIKKGNKLPHIFYFTILTVI